MRLLKSISVVALLLSGCSKSELIPSPLGLPPLKVSRRPSEAQIALGRKLFFETRLSLDNTISCASCHNPDTGFADPRKVSVGVGGKPGRRNAPTVLNAAFWDRQFWDGRAASLEEQAAGPMGNEIEMNHQPEQILAKLNADPAYVKAFGGGRISMEQLLDAIAAYERTLLSGNSPADRYLYAGDKSALSEDGVEGLRVFKRHCVSCHTFGEKHGLFTDQQFHNIGIGVNPEGELLDQGRGQGTFRTPSLRNVARTAPYMHDGSLKTLREVVDYYIGGGNSNPHLDRLIKPFELTSKERTGLIAFLEALNGDLPK